MATGGFLIRRHEPFRLTTPDYFRALLNKGSSDGGGPPGLGRKLIQIEPMSQRAVITRTSKTALQREEKEWEKREKNAIGHEDMNMLLSLYLRSTGIILNENDLSIIL